MRSSASPHPRHAGAGKEAVGGLATHHRHKAVLWHRANSSIAKAERAIHVRRLHASPWVISGASRAAHARHGEIWQRLASHIPRNVRGGIPMEDAEGSRRRHWRSLSSLFGRESEMFVLACHTDSHKGSTHVKQQRHQDSALHPPSRISQTGWAMNTDGGTNHCARTKKQL